MEKKIDTLFKEYVDECRYARRLREETIRGYKDVYKAFRNMMPAVTSPEDITIQMMNNFFKILHTRTRVVGRDKKKVVGVKESTTRTYWSKLNSFFEWLVARAYMERNPLRSVPIKEPEYTDKRSLSRNEIEKIYTAIMMHSKNQFLAKRDTCIISVCLFMGLRKGEVAGLQVRDVDIDKRMITVRGETSKSKKTRTIPINRSLLMHLQDYLDVRRERKCTTEFLFVSDVKDSGLTKDGYKHLVKRLCRLSGVRFHLHRFRHSFACGLFNENVNMAKIQKLMGHVDLRMTQRYLRSLGAEDCDSDIQRLSLETLV